MQHSSVCLRPTQALYEIFVSLRPTTRKPAFLIPRATRYYRTNASRGVAKVQASSSKFDPFPDIVKNDDIKGNEVQVVDPSTYTLSEPQLKSRLLSMLGNRWKLVAEGVPILQAPRKDGQAAQDLDDLLLIQVGTTDNDLPVCKVVERRFLSVQRAERQKQEKERARERRAKSAKEIELNWAVDGHDLDSKLRQMGSFLSKGRKVEIIIANKRKSRRASPDEAAKVLDTIRNKLIEIGAKETKAMEGALLQQAVLTIEKP